MAGNLFTVTDAGRAALISAGNTGTAAHKVTQIGVSTVAFDSTDKTLKVLPGERKRIATLAGDNVATDMIHVTLKDDTADQYTLYGFGLYFENGVLFGTYSQATPIMEKSPAAMLLLAADMAFKSIDTAQISFGDATFTNPPATTDRQGVVQLATNAETTAGTDKERAVTPAGLQAALGPALATKSAVGHRHAILEVDGLQAALDAKLNLSGGTMSGALSLYGGAGKNYSSNLTLNADGYTPYIRSSKAAGGAVEFVNGANSTVNLSLAESGLMTLRTRPSWGATPWDTANFDPASRVAKTGDTMSGDLYINSGGLHLSGWGGNQNAGVAFLNAAGSRYVFFDGTQYSMPGAELLVAQGNRVWHNGNFNPAAYQPAGNYQPAGSYQPAGNYARVNSRNDGNLTYWVSGSAPNIASISNDYVCATFSNGGNQSASAVVQFHREGSFAAYFGLDTDNQWAVGGRSMGGVRYRLWHEGNFNPGNYAPRRNNNGNAGYVGCDNGGNSIIINWSSGGYNIYTDGQYQGNIVTVGGGINDIANYAASRGAQVQWASGISELGGVVTGADITCDAGAPWVLEGLRTSGGGNRIYMRVVWLRNQ